MDEFMRVVVVEEKGGGGCISRLWASSATDTTLAVVHRI
jgi:hypothetical protein